MSLTIMRRIKFCAGHRLHKHGGKCEHFHGHNYMADFYVTGGQVDDIGRVIDFFLVHYKEHQFPVFNVADTAISIGAALMAIELFITPQAERATEVAPAESLLGDGEESEVRSPNLGSAE